MREMAMLRRVMSCADDVTSTCVEGSGKRHKHGSGLGWMRYAPRDSTSCYLPRSRRVIARGRTKSSMNDACDQTRRLVRIASCHEHMNVRELAVQGSAEWIRTVNIAQAEAGEGGARTSTQEDHPALERPALTRSVQANGQPQRIGVLSTGVRFARGCDAGRARARAGRLLGGAPEERAPP